MRTDQYIGLNNRGIKLTSDLKRKEMCKFTGAFYTEFLLFMYYEDEGWCREPKYIEFIQAELWSSGPLFFMALQTIYGTQIEESLWTDKEIEAML